MIVAISLVVIEKVTWHVWVLNSTGKAILHVILELEEHRLPLIRGILLHANLEELRVVLFVVEYLLCSEVHSDCAETEDPTSNVHAPLEMLGSEYLIEKGELNDEPLHPELTQEDNDEPFVIQAEEVREYVHLWPAQFAASELVAKGHHHEGVEEDRVVLSHSDGRCSRAEEVGIHQVVGWVGVPVWDTVKHHNQHKDLVGSLNEDIAPHNFFDNLLILVAADIMLLVTVFIVVIFFVMMLERGRLCSQTNGSKGIHNEIDPQKLDDAEWWVTKGRSTNQYGEAANNIDTELELQELSNVVKDISSPTCGSEDRAEIVVRQYYMRSVFSDLGASAHAEWNMSIL